MIIFLQLSSVLLFEMSFDNMWTLMIVCSSEHDKFFLLKFEKKANPSACKVC